MRLCVHGCARGGRGVKAAYQSQTVNTTSTHSLTHPTTSMYLLDNTVQVYWNSRLHTEHDRVVGMLREGDVVLDMMAGIGPFALPAAKNKSCKVYANDLNPASYAALTENIELNKVKRFVTASNQDARVFAREVVSKTPLDSPDHPPSVFHHAVMNLPATATEFLDVFRGLFADRRDSLTPEDLPQIHCYCFSKEEAGEAGVGHDYAADAIHLCEVGLGGPIDPAHCAVHEVRDVAPRKRMMCVSFRLPAAIAFDAAPIDLDAAASLTADLVATTEVEMSASDGDSTTCESRPTKKPRLDAP
jgi:tRNA (guanine37-N1)-methyltransferase